MSDFHVSYWAKGYNAEDALLWEGMVYAKEKGTQIEVDGKDTDKNFQHLCRTKQIVRLEWEKMWEEIFPLQLPSASLSGSEVLHANTD